MRTVLIVHEESSLCRYGLSAWLRSFSDLAGMIVIKEKKSRLCRRIKREIKRVGVLRFADVVGFRIYYKIFLSKRDKEWERNKLLELKKKYPADNDNVSTLVTDSPNSSEAEAFIRKNKPDIMIARCKTLLKEKIFSIPSRGTFVMHPGICPEYRNAHGCFWALASGDLGQVGMTLLKIDKGVDTGPVYGYYRYDYDEVKESHIVIQHNVVLENLDDIKDKLLEIGRGEAAPYSTEGRPSATWGQPWLSSYLKWKYRARKK